MIESVQFRNFKALRDAILPLGRFTLIVGPNGSGKSTALQALRALSQPEAWKFRDVVSMDLLSDEKAEVEIQCKVNEFIFGVHWKPDSVGRIKDEIGNTLTLVDLYREKLIKELKRISVFSLDARAMCNQVQVQPNARLQQDGSNLAGVLDQLQGEEPERFEALNYAFGSFIPEFDRILLEVTGPGSKTLSLRTRAGKHKIPATQVSQGTLLALGILTIAYIPNSPSLVCVEEPDRGIHPRLLRDVQDALYRLSYPESYGEESEPVQVIVTTHSPYLLDLYRDHPEEVVIAQKIGQEAHFERLSDRSDLDEILRDSQLGEIWYTGILGGVPLQP